MNRAEKPFEVTLKSHQKIPAGKMNEFQYVDGTLNLNANQELLPVAVHQNVGLGSGFTITIPAHSFIVLTSME